MTPIVRRFYGDEYDPHRPHDNVSQEWDFATFRAYDIDGALVEERAVSPMEYALACRQYLDVLVPEKGREVVVEKGLEQRPILVGIMEGAEAYLAGSPPATQADLLTHIGRMTYAIQEIARTVRGLILYNVGDFEPTEELGIPAPPPPPASDASPGPS